MPKHESVLNQNSTAPLRVNIPKDKGNINTLHMRVGVVGDTFLALKLSPLESFREFLLKDELDDQWSRTPWHLNQRTTNLPGAKHTRFWKRFTD